MSDAERSSSWRTFDRERHAPAGFPDLVVRLLRHWAYWAALAVTLASQTLLAVLDETGEWLGWGLATISAAFICRSRWRRRSDHA